LSISSEEKIGVRIRKYGVGRKLLAGGGEYQTWMDGWRRVSVRGSLWAVSGNARSELDQLWRCVSESSEPCEMLELRRGVRGSYLVE
jgi:hypothetical protein